MPPRGEEENNVGDTQSIEDESRNLRMSGHGKNIAPIHDIKVPEGPLSPAATGVVSTAPEGVSEPQASIESYSREAEPSSAISPYSSNDSIHAAEVPFSPQVQPVADTLQTVITPPPPVEPLASRSHKKPLVIGVIIAAILLVFGGGGAAYALWYSNPDKVLADAVMNSITSKTMVTHGSFTMTDDTNKGQVSLDFKTQTNNPKLAGSLEGVLKIKYPDFDITLKGAGMAAESGDYYFKIDNAAELLDEALKTQYGMMYAQEPSMKPVVEKVRTFIKKIDGKWIKVEKSYLGEYQKKYEEQQECTKKAFDNFYKDSTQQKQVSDLYVKHKFISIKDTGISENINGENSVKYDLKFNAEKANSFGEEIENTDIYKAVDKCYETEESSYSTDANSEDKMTEQELKDAQKELDKITTTAWIGRFSHDATKVELKGDEGKTSYKFFAVLDSSTQPNLKAPASALNVKELQKDIEDISSAASEVGGGSLGGSRTSPNQADAQYIQKKAEAYNVMEGAKYPTLDELKNSKYEEVKLDNEIAARLSSEAPSAEYKDRIQYTICDDGFGYSIHYWDENTSSISEDIGFGCAAIAGGALPSIEQLRKSFTQFR